MSKIIIHKSLFADHNVIEVNVGTNFHHVHDNDLKNKCYTVFRLIDQSGTKIKCKINGKESVDEFESIEIILIGGGEYKTFVDSLRYALGVLTAESEEII